MSDPAVIRPAAAADPLGARGAVRTDVDWPGSLDPDEIHLWLAFYDEIDNEHLHTRYRHLLDGPEVAQEARFYFARDRRRYLVTRALVRTVLSRYAPRHPRDWTFGTNAYGRPEIADPPRLQPGLSFNVSHTHSLIVLGVTRERALGVDVENVCAREVALEVAERFFAPPEASALARVPPHQAQYRFWEYWTFKESYMKARGMGLSVPLDKFAFHFPDARAVDITIDRELADDPARWQFWQFRPSPEYLVAVCAERTTGPPARVTARRVVPLEGEWPLALECLRLSEAPVDRASRSIAREGP